MYGRMQEAVARATSTSITARAANKWQTISGHRSLYHSSKEAVIEIKDAVVAGAMKDDASTNRLSQALVHS